MALPQNTTIPTTQSNQFAKLQDGKNKFRILSDVIVGWEGWKDRKPFRHPGAECKIDDNQVDLNQSGKPNKNYFWAMVVWNYSENRVQTLQLTQKTIMNPLYDLEQNSDWGDLKNYDIEINKKKDGDKTSYSVLGIPPRALSKDIKEAYEASTFDLNKLFDGEYPAPVDKLPIAETKDVAF